MTTSSDLVGRLGLGTVQFGLDYGIARTAPRPHDDLARSVVEGAVRAGVGLVDTAPRYGDAERVLGRIGLAHAGLRVVTKTAEAADGDDPVRRVVEGLERSLEALRLERVHGLLEHRPAELLGPRGALVWRGLVEVHERGLARSVGVSVSTPEQLDAVLDRYPVHLVQVPSNVLDARFLTPERTLRLRDLGVEVHVRSVFLQGALLADPSVSARVPGLAERVRRFQGIARELGLTPLRAALGVVLAREGVDAALFGAQDVRELEEVLAAARGAGLDAGAFDRLRCDDPDLLDPARWPEPRT